MLCRDKQETKEVVKDREHYKDELFNTLSHKLEVLSALSTKRDKPLIYETLSDVQELVNCLGNCYLTTSSGLSSVARHEAFMKVNKSRAEELGGYFNGKIGEVQLDS